MSVQKFVEYAFDLSKEEENRVKHGIGLSDFDGFDEEPLVLVDARHDYGETRFRAFGRIDGRGHCLVYTIRDGAMRLISFRRARDKEMRNHGR